MNISDASQSVNNSMIWPTISPEFYANAFWPIVLTLLCVVIFLIWLVFHYKQELADYE